MLDNNKNFWTFLLLSTVTCGIYGIIFYIKYFEDVNKVCYDDGEPLPSYWMFLLLGIVTCGIYSYYMYYKLGDKLYNCGQRRGVPITENGQTILIWALVGLVTGGLGIYVAMYFCIENYNKLASHYNAMVGNGGQPMNQNGYAPSNQANAWGGQSAQPNQPNSNDYWNNPNNNNDAF